MLIPIDDNLALKSDEHCWALCKRVSRKNRQTGEPEDAWVGFSFYTSVERAIAGACEREMRLSNAEGLVEAIEATRAVAARYGALLDVALEKTQGR